MSCCTSPASTHSTTSMVSASVTRMPWMKWPFLPSRPSAASICGPPPCTTTGLMPTSLSSTTSSAKSAWSSGSVMALPPYLITMVLPWKRRIYGSAWARISALSRGAMFRTSGMGNGVDRPVPNCAASGAASLPSDPAGHLETDDAVVSVGVRDNEQQAERHQHQRVVPEKHGWHHRQQGEAPEVRRGAIVAHQHAACLVVVEHSAHNAPVNQLVKVQGVRQAG